MTDATDDRIRELEIMIRLIDIGGSPSSSARSAGWILEFLNSFYASEPSFNEFYSDEASTLGRSSM
jgi:hypothetical protein